MRQLPQLQRRAATLAGAAVMAAALSACSGGQVVASNADQFYVRVPAGWKVYEESQLLHTSKWSSLVSNRPRYFMAASDGPHPKSSQPLSPSKYPWVVLLVADLSGPQRDSLTLGTLQDVLVPVDQLSQQGVGVQALQQGRLLVNGALRGTKVAFEVGAGMGGGAIDYEQETWVNSATNRVWALMVGCSPACYQANGSIINSVVDSFYVSDREHR